MSLKLPTNLATPVAYETFRDDALADLARHNPSAKRRILNLGAGTQSSVLYLMMCRGELEPAEVAIFSDTQSEQEEVLPHLAWLRALPESTIPIVDVTAGNLREDALEFMQRRKSADGKRYASMPLYVLNPDGSTGQLNRQCTKEYKVIPIERYIRREVLGLSHGERVPTGVIVEQVFGLHFDERSRMRRPEQKWSIFDYPLIDLKMRRLQVIEWAEKNYPSHAFPRSACVECPFMSNKELRRMRDDHPNDWRKRVDFDHAIRDRDRERQRERATVHAEPYLHRSCVPLELANLDDDQNEFAWGMENECEGMCGV